MTNKITVTPDYTRYYSEKSKEWAISDKKVDNTDYSSKYYANESKKQADISTAKTTEVVESGNNAVSNIENARDNAITDIINQENLSIDNVNTASAAQISNVNKAGSTQVANVNSAGTTQINLAKEQVTLATNQANIAKNQATIATNKTSEVVSSGNEALSNIDTAKTGAIKDITDLKNTSVSNITTAKNNAITSITTQETTSKNNVITTGNEQVERVNLTGVDNRTPIFTKSEVETNEGVYQNVYDLKHSTFDLSKFTVVGSPTITDDGVASGFSTSNYITYLSQNLRDNFDIIFPKFKIPDVTQNASFLFTTSGHGLRVQLNSGKIRTLVFYGSDQYPVIRGTTALQNNIEYLYRVTRTKQDNTYTLTAFLSSDNGQTWAQEAQITMTQDLYNSGLVGYLGGNPNSGTRIFNGSIDLSQFSITVDGKEVFSGNKTGLDVIKPDNYEVVGSPVISEDGVASGFSDSNYLITPDLGLENANSWEIQVPLDGFLSGGELTGNCLIGKFTYGEQKIIVGRANTTSNIYFYAIKNNVAIGSCHLGYHPNDGTGILKIGFNGSKYYLTRIINGQSTTAEFESTEKIDNMSGIYVGYKYQGNPIDLNAFKIYVDGNLVYQPCLKIPYTESKTGSKIVDANYRDRVQDVYEQYGTAMYYTLDEENKNFTLPMGEIYGMIGQRSLISSTVTETNRVDIYSDKTCLICGNVSTAGTINLPIELANNNYFITLSTSEKTATSFTTTATGDYILIGKVI